MKRNEAKGIVLFTRQHREKDKLVKIFTEKYGKMMFFVRQGNRANHSLTPALMPFTEACYIGDFRPEGLSFLNDCKEVQPFQQLQQDIFLNAYGTYLLGLVDAAIDDRVYDPALYDFTRQSLSYIDQGYDAEIITNIFELQILTRFGFSFNWDKCGVCGGTSGKFDFSSQYLGILCEKHWHVDQRRYHADPRAIHLMRLFTRIQYSQIDSIKVKPETKQALRQTIDLIYEEFVGIHLKSKKFIDQMKSWEDVLRLPPRNGTEAEPEKDDSARNDWQTEGFKAMIGTIKYLRWERKVEMALLISETGTVRASWESGLKALLSKWLNEAAD